MLIARPTFLQHTILMVATHSNESYDAFTHQPPPLPFGRIFFGAGNEKRKGEQLKWSRAFTLYIGSFPCAQLPGPVHTARLGRVCFLYILA